IVVVGLLSAAYAQASCTNPPFCAGAPHIEAEWIPNVPNNLGYPTQGGLIHVTGENFQPGKKIGVQIENCGDQMFYAGWNLLGGPWGCWIPNAPWMCANYPPYGSFSTMSLVSCQCESKDSWDPRFIRIYACQDNGSYCSNQVTIEPKCP